MPDSSPAHGLSFGEFATLDDYLKSLDLCYFEVAEGFTGLKDEHVWIRPAPGRLFGSKDVPVPDDLPFNFA